MWALLGIILLGSPAALPQMQFGSPQGMWGYPGMYGGSPMQVPNFAGFNGIPTGGQMPLLPLMGMQPFQQNANLQAVLNRAIAPKVSQLSSPDLENAPKLDLKPTSSDKKSEASSEAATSPKVDVAPPTLFRRPTAGAVESIVPIPVMPPTVKAPTNAPPAAPLPVAPQTPNIVPESHDMVQATHEFDSATVKEILSVLTTPTETPTDATQSPPAATGRTPSVGTPIAKPSSCARSSGGGGGDSGNGGNTDIGCDDSAGPVTGDDTRTTYEYNGDGSDPSSGSSLHSSSASEASIAFSDYNNGKYEFLRKFANPILQSHPQQSVASIPEMYERTSVAFSSGSSASSLA